MEIRFADRPGEQVFRSGRRDQQIDRKNVLLAITEGGDEVRGMLHSGLVNVASQVPFVQIVKST